MFEDKSHDPAVCEVLAGCEGEVETAFDRVSSIKACSIGAESGCCRVCAMGPCRLVGKHTRGICGATRATVAARNFARAVAAGSAAHSDHGRGIAHALLAVATGAAKDYRIRDEAKLHAVAGYLGIKSAGRPVEEVAKEIAETALAEFGRQEGELLYAKRATKRRQEIWAQEKITPRGIDREVVELMHRTHMGVDQDAENILDQVLTVEKLPQKCVKAVPVATYKLAKGSFFPLRVSSQKVCITEFFETWFHALPLNTDTRTSDPL